MKSKRFFALLSAAIMLMSAAGCNGDNSSDTESTSAPAASSTSSAADDTSSGATSVFVADSVLKSDLPADTVVVSVEGHEDMNITFGDFMKDYKYFLSGYQITDDTSFMYIEMATAQRQYIANSLLNEKIMEKKFYEYGLSLTEEDEAQIDADTQANIQYMKEIYQSMALLSDDSLSEDEVVAYGEQQYAAMLQYCGMTEDDIRNWQRSSVIQTKLVEYVKEQNPYDYSESEAQVQILEDSAKAAYAEDPSTLNPDGMKNLWLPEGTRAVQHILIGFDEVTQSEISTLRSEGSDADADALIEEKLTELSEELAEIQDKLAAGEEMEALIAEYSDDANGAQLYYAAPGSTSTYGTEFANAAMDIAAIGETAVCSTDYGYHIISYVSEATVSADVRKGYVDAVHVYLESAYHAQIFDELLTEWRNEYSFTIDSDALILLTEETTTE